MIKTFSFSLLFIFLSCSEKTPLEKALNSKNPKIKTVVNQIEQHEVQILFSEILEENDSIFFKEAAFQVNDTNYFYPASSVKFPIAVLALEKITQQKNSNRNTLFLVEGDSVKTTIAKEIKKIFAVSDNAAYNRLFEFLGKDNINKRLREKGLLGRISHRLSVAKSAELTTKRISFYKGDTIIYETTPVLNDSLKPLSLHKLKKGIGYTIGDSLVNKPMDFSKKNYLPVTSLHQIMKRLFFPELYSKKQQFHLSEEDRLFLINTMKILPKEAGYDVPEYYDSYVKFFLFGDTKESMPNHIEIYNKVGYAYGYLTDCAYIINKKSNKKYIITATIHVNENQIYNDGVYEYESVGIPFLAQLGRELVK